MDCEPNPHFNPHPTEPLELRLFTPRFAPGKWPQLGFRRRWCRSLALMGNGGKVTGLDGYRNRGRKTSWDGAKNLVPSSKLTWCPGWKITIFNREYIFNSSIFQPAMLVYQRVKNGRNQLPTYINWLYSPPRLD